MIAVTLVFHFMSALKRSVSPVALVSQASASHSSVTLYTLDNHSPKLSTPRRSKRSYNKPSYTDGDSGDSVPDLEDLIVTPKKRQRKTESVNDSPPTKTPKTPKPVQQALTTPHPAPTNWREVFDTLKAMRANMMAPVDTMGCDMAQRHETDPRVRFFHLTYNESNRSRSNRTSVIQPSYPSCSHLRQKMQ